MTEMAEEPKVGCEHYKRRCAFLSPCCGKYYTCRLCHDDKENHTINRKEVVTIKCLKCEQPQKVQFRCEKCDVVFGQYFCPVCRLYDDKDKEQFHCDGCGICRVGGRDNYFHCDKCDLCLPMTMKEGHKCIEKASQSDCPVCREYLHTSRTACLIPPCGHLIHRDCFRGMLETGNYACPVCSQSMVDMRDYWKVLEDEIENTPMPEEYRNLKVMVLCRDCHKETRTAFHVSGLRCMACGSFNTARTADTSSQQETSPNPQDPASSQTAPSGDSTGQSSARDNNAGGASGGAGPQ